MVDRAWRAAGLDVALADPWLPFFMQWDDPTDQPGRLAVRHRLGATGVAWLELAPGDDRFTRWTAGADLPVRLVTGPPGRRAVALTTPAGEVVVDPGPQG